MDTRIESLLKSLERNHHRFKETFIDEDTGEEVTVDRDEVVEFDTTEEERELMENIIADVAHLVMRIWRLSGPILLGSGHDILMNSIWS